MQSSWRRITLISLFTIICGGFVFSEPAGWNWNKRYLKSGSEVSGVIAVEVPDGGAEGYSITVPDEYFGIRIQVTESPADLDIALYDENGNDVAIAETEMFNEKIIITRISEPPLASGKYTVRVLYQLPFLPVYQGGQKKNIPFNFRYEAIENQPRQDIIPDKLIHDELLPSEGMLRTYRYTVPEKTEAFRIDLFDTKGDLDILVTKDKPFIDPYQTDYRSESLLSRESLVIRGTDRFLTPGDYYISVIDQVVPDVVQEFSMVVTEGTEPPVYLTSLPDITPPADPLQNALLSTVEIFTASGGGSGCLIDPEGYILTSWHVVRGPSGEADDELVIGLSLDHEVPSRELFVGEVVGRDISKDLALVKIHSGLYGQPLNAGFRFPHFTMGDPDELMIGDPLGFIGYPEVGGTGSRVSITFTRGIVSGFERSSEMRIIKTDAQINKGNSGGAAVNSLFQLVGIPSQIVGNGNQKLGYIYPVSQIPPQWFELMK
ncbi:MAG: S1C family serine protease [Spirochaetia bacterium]